jgi:hypothetical protein
MAQPLVQPEALRAAIFSPHAMEQMIERQIEAAQVRAVLEAPEAVLDVRPGRVVAQGVIEPTPGRKYLLRVFADIDRKPAEIVTVYRTSKIDKYRSRT